ncbi:MAG: hypothetical protein EPN97_11830 [Alphaproteobacteria bacterium]|nr:MAG: hypothetical protein EPN97_11830 [Alphaproteobacteria bacterium]
MWNIRNAFQKTVQNWESHREHKARFRQALQAIDAEDLTALESSLTGGYTKKQANELLDKAVETDNAAIFSAVLSRAAGNDPNYNFVSEYKQGDPWAWESLLYRAMSHGKKNVTLSLAQNPASDITLAGHRSRGIAMNKEGGCVIQVPYEDSPLTLARKKGMPEVLAVLAERTAGLNEEKIARIRDEITALRREAAQARPGKASSPAKRTSFNS